MADWESVQSFIHSKWDAEVVPTLAEYIKVPNLSPAFDPEFSTNGLQEEAMALLTGWLKLQPVKGMSWELLEEKGKTPFLVIEIAGTVSTAKTLLMYGHMDKQPPMLPWANGLGPYTPVIKDDKLYGRGGADDGYAIFASVLSVLSLQQHNIPHSRVAIIVEADEESGSSELPNWIAKVNDRLGDVDLVICLDSGALTYDRMWLTTALRGVAAVTVECSTVTEGVHSGIAGGVCPDSTRILRALLDRVEDAHTGNVLVKELYCDIPKWAVESLTESATEVGYEAFVAQFPLAPGVQPEVTSDVVKLAIRNFWQPSLTVIGADGFPPSDRAGNVLRPLTRFKLSFRSAPLARVAEALPRIKQLLESEPLHGVKVDVKIAGAADGWAMPELSSWLTQSLTDSSLATFGKPMSMTALGGTIPFMGMLGNLFPAAQFVITGVLGPQSNAHGPNEFLSIPYGKAVNTCMARVVADHFVNRTDK